MSIAPRRNLRNCNTCPTVPNPLAANQQLLELQTLLPEALLASLPTTPTLTCAQISSLPTFALPKGPEEALRCMQAATEWQIGSVRALRAENRVESEKKEENEGHYLQVERRAEHKEAPKEMENSIYSVLFQNELQDFIMNPPPAQRSYDSQKL